MLRLAAAAALLLCLNPAWAQVCNTGGQFPPPLVLTSQAEVDAFACTEVLGGLRITGSDVTDLSGLAELERVGQSLQIDSTSVQDMDAFSSLTYVGGEVLFFHNHGLEHLDGLSALVWAGGVRIAANDALTDAGGFSALERSRHIAVYSNPALTTLGSPTADPTAPAFPRLAQIDSYVQITDNPQLRELRAFPVWETGGTVIDLSRNERLDQIAGFEQVPALVGGLYIRDNPALVRVEGFDALDQMRGAFGAGLRVERNASLVDCQCALSRIVYEATIEGGLYISDNAPNGSCNTAEDVLEAYGDGSACRTGTAALPESAYGPQSLTAFPNPSSGDARLRFALAAPGSARLVVYDSLGRAVRVVYEGPVTGEITVSVAGLASGFYVARLTAQDRTDTVPFTVAR